MKEDLFLRTYSCVRRELQDISSGFYPIDYIISGEVFGNVQNKLRKKYDGSKIIELRAIYVEVSTYLINKGTITIKFPNDLCIELLSESAEGLQALAEEFELPIEKRKRIPKRLSKNRRENCR